MIIDDSSLDPSDWTSMRQQGHQMLDDMFDYQQQRRQRPVWQRPPDALRATFREPLPRAEGDLASVHQRFLQHILPYAIGNAHPGFMGWVHGGGTPVGMLAEMLAAGLNANLGGRDQMPLEIERQIVQWMVELFGFPAGANGVFTSGSSMANLMAVLVARSARIGPQLRCDGIAGEARRLSGYTSLAAHGSIERAFDMAGLGGAALRRIGVDGAHRLRSDLLQQAIEADRAAGLQPFFLAATAGSVDTGAIDALGELAALARREGLWLHVDGAYGALAMLAPDMVPLLAGIEHADSLAFDFHKWGQVPYDAGFLLVRDGALQLATFAQDQAYLQRYPRGMTANSPWPCDLGPELSRGFRALKTWFTLQVLGADRVGNAISRSCALARLLGRRV